MSLADLAEEYSVGRSTIHRIIHRPRPGLTAIQMASQRRDYAVGGGVVLVTDDSQHWTLRYSGPAILRSDDAIDADHAWAVGDHELLHTDDGGLHWGSFTEPLTDAKLQAVHFSDPRTGWAVGSGKLFRTNDAALTWHQLATPCGAEAACFSEPSDGWIGVAGRVYRSIDAGDNWRLAFEIPADPNNHPHIRDLQCSRGGVVWAYFTGEGVAASHAPYMAYRGDGAGPWTLVMREIMTTPGRLEDPHGGSYPGPMSALSTSSAVFVTFTPPTDPPVDVVFSTDDGGRLTPAQPVPRLRTPTSASFLDDNTGWVLGEGANGDEILATRNGGRSWTTQLTRSVPVR